MPGSNNMYPLGYVTLVLPSGDDVESSQRILNLLYQIPTQPSAEADQAAEAIDPSTSSDEDGTTQVEDLRKQLVISIDPDTCRDVDDALSIRRLPTGGFWVGVHIADVGRFVAKDDVIDRSARRRMTSFYSSTNQVYHMLPSKLSENVCSLKDSADRRVISVYLETDKHCQVIDSEKPIVRRSIIKNQQKMTYDEAQEMINRTRFSAINWEANSVLSAVAHLHEIAKRLRIRRLREGRFFFDEPEDPFATVDKLVYCESHQLIEELMIRSNAEVARLIVGRFPEAAPVRRQKAPSDEEIEDWCRQHEDIVGASFYFRRFEIFRRRFGEGFDNGDDEESSDYGSKSVAILESTFRAMESVGPRGDVTRMSAVIGAENRHPLHAMTLKKWYQIQVTVINR